MISKLLVLLSSLVACANSVPSTRDGPNIQPTVNLSAIRQLVCPAAGSLATGFLIADHILVTADHVARDAPCYDAQTGAPLMVYKEDPQHDLALMTSAKLPTNMPYIKYSCQGFVPGEKYNSYGISPYNENLAILRMNILTATKEKSEADSVIDFPYSEGMTVLDGAVAPGTSGGPVINAYGYAVAVNNAGNEVSTLEYQLKDGLLCQSISTTGSSSSSKPSQ